MANFQRITIIIAGVLLVIMVILLSIVLFNASNNQKWPPIIPSCPDYWLDESPLGDGSKCINTRSINVGNCKSAPDFSTGSYVGSSGLCYKYKWATETCNGIAWDGITYGVNNPCDALNNTS